MITCRFGEDVHIIAVSLGDKVRQGDLTGTVVGGEEYLADDHSLFTSAYVDWGNGATNSVPIDVALLHPTPSNGGPAMTVSTDVPSASIALWSVQAALTTLGVAAEYIEDSTGGDRLDIIVDADGPAYLTVTTQMLEDYTDELDDMLDPTPGEPVFAVALIAWGPMPHGCGDALLRAVVAGAESAAGAAWGLYRQQQAKIEAAGMAT